MEKYNKLSVIILMFFSLSFFVSCGDDNEKVETKEIVEITPEEAIIGSWSLVDYNYSTIMSSTFQHENVSGELIINSNGTFTMTGDVIIGLSWSDRNYNEVNGTYRLLNHEDLYFDVNEKQYPKLYFRSNITLRQCDNSKMVLHIKNLDAIVQYQNWEFIKLR